MPCSDVTLKDSVKKKDILKIYTFCNSLFFKTINKFTLLRLNCVHTMGNLGLPFNLSSSEQVIAE